MALMEDLAYYDKAYLTVRFVLWVFLALISVADDIIHYHVRSPGYAPRQAMP